MFRMTLKQIQEIIDDQIEMYPEGKDRNILLRLSNTIYDYENPESEEETQAWIECLQWLDEADELPAKKKKDGKKKTKKK